ncbi:MAG: hypothetical protein ACM3XM_01155 [Mycobacterium leprae]
MKPTPVEFQCQVPSTGPVALQLQGMLRPVPMALEADHWAVTLDLAPGTYLYRFELPNGATVNDCRRTLQRNLDGQWWSLLHVAEEGPVFIQRTHPVLNAVAVCRGISNASMPLLIIEHAQPADFPVVLWTEVAHLYHDSFMQVFLYRPDREVAFSGEFVLEQARASPDFRLKFWLSVDIDWPSAQPGTWEFLVAAEGCPIARVPLFLEL